MRLVFFCSGGADGVATLELLLEGHDVVLAVLPRQRGEGAWKHVLRRWLRREGPAEALLRRRRVPVLRMPKQPRREHLARLASAAPEVACIAAYPFLLPSTVLDALGCPVINFHPSLLPRHRGLLPLFWVFHADDRRAGATVHLVDAGMDSGAILAQSEFELARGATVSELAQRLRASGAALMRDVLSDWPRALAQARPQDEAHATRAPRVRPGEKAVDFAAWGCERIWHFLHGLLPWFVEPLVDERGRRVAYRSVRGYEAGAPRATPGMIETCEGHWRLHCKDGHVSLGRD